MTCRRWQDLEFTPEPAMTTPAKDPFFRFVVTAPEQEAEARACARAREVKGTHTPVVHSLLVDGMAAADAHARLRWLRFRKPTLRESDWVLTSAGFTSKPEHADKEYERMLLKIERVPFPNTQQPKERP